VARVPHQLESISLLRSSAAVSNPFHGMGNFLPCSLFCETSWLTIGQSRRSDQDWRNSPLLQKVYGPDTCILVKNKFRNSPLVICCTIWDLPWRNSNVPKLTPRPYVFNPLNPELNPICYLLALLGAHHFFHVSRIRVKLLTFRLLMLYIYGAPILDVSRSHTTTQHSR